MNSTVIDSEELRRLREDAARYRWLRENGKGAIYVLQSWQKGDEHSPLTLAQRDDLDATIDAALAQAQKVTE